MIPDTSMSAGEAPASSAGSEPELIYHYTSLSGLRGIIDSAKLWATDVWFMNDAAEATFGREAIKRYLYDKRKSGSATDIDVQFCDGALELLAKINKILERPDVRNTYIACLSEGGDQLSQWRAYCRQGGVSIGFDRLALKQLGYNLPKPINFALEKVTYESSAQNAFLDECCQRLCSSLQAPVDPADLRDTVLQFVNQAIELSATFKHFEFRDEQEYRIHTSLGSARHTSEVLKFRDSPMGITPYLQIPLHESDKEPITVVKNVIIGPQPHQPETERAIHQFFQVHEQHGHARGVDIDVSKIPLRL